MPASQPQDSAAAESRRRCVEADGSRERGGLGLGHETGGQQAPWTKCRRREVRIHTSAKNISGIATRNRTWLLMLARNEPAWPGPRSHALPSTTRHRRGSHVRKRYRDTEPDRTNRPPRRFPRTLRIKPWSGPPSTSENSGSAESTASPAAGIIGRV